MTTEALPPAIADFFDATNAADRARFLAAFADDAVLDDWGHVYAGRDAIAGWNETDNMGVSSHLDVLGFEQQGGAYVVSIQVTGDGYNGGGSMTFSLDGDLISRVVIAG
ncbi:nuclear transport factor 2 family protein [Aeromicrobium ginsengisoli]|uniref:Nuclear transport factor 2 family protein n=1 Tax=Aeromicrobium ginsengisoli TaxID=363867 RepID=A0A5M4FFR0_9ACTN|nr:nuclear transport factor 2 family protein [Aeromicrobium ginsengisoli]KAA1397681.1 nuclear transport factor 2 family protein [Aeromicrobium ginsengisoli]